MFYFKTNSEKAFYELYQENHNRVRGTLFRMLCERAKAELLDELEQEVFLKVWQNLPRFNFKSQISTWIYRISVNTAIDHIRKNKMTFSPLSESEQELTFQDEQRTESVLAVQNLLNQMDEKHRSVLVLYYFQDRSIKEISQILNVKVGTIKSRLNTAKKKSLQFLSEGE